jgi:hypothetical protein
MMGSRAVDTKRWPFLCVSVARLHMCQEREQELKWPNQIDCGLYITPPAAV